MTAFLSELGGKLADRWLSALVVPGVLWAFAAAVGVHLGQGAALDLGRLSTWFDDLATRPAANASGTVVLAAVGSFVLCAGIGILANALGALVERVWSSPGNLLPASWILVRRQRRWDAARENLRTAIRAASELPSEQRRRAHHRVLRLERKRRRLGESRPVRPTRIGDRYAWTADRAAEVHGVSRLDLVWPRLWSVLPDQIRAEIAAARDAYAAAARLFSWALLYLLVSLVWWPASLIAVSIAVAGVLRAGPTADRLAALIDTAMDLHLRDLASQLGLSVGTAPVQVGQAIVSALRIPARPA